MTDFTQNINMALPGEDSEQASNPACEDGACRQPLRIVFFGTTDFASAGLKALAKSGHIIAGVVTTPDRPQGRHLRLMPCDVKQTAAAMLPDVAVLEPEKLKDPTFITALRQLDADLFVVIAYRMLPQEVWSMPSKGTINIHGSLLPSYRGAAPIARAIMAGEKHTGVSVFFLNREIDTGDVIGSLSTPVGDNETFGEVYTRLMELGAQLLTDTVDLIATGNAGSAPQTALSSRHPISAAPKIFTSDCEIDWSRPAQDIHNQIRGLSPAPAAFSTLHSKTSAPVKIKILRSELCPDEGLSPEKRPGEVEITNKKMTVYCGTGAINILTLQPAGKKEMDIKSYLNGARLTTPCFT